MSQTPPHTLKPKRIRRPQGPRTKEVGREAQKVAACILEVLGGVRTPTDAAKALSVSLPRYYKLEAQALDGLVGACAPRAKGRVRSPDKELALQQKEVQRLRKECARYAALVRAAQRTVGLGPAPVPEKVKGRGKGKGSRRPTVRALKAATLMQPEEALVQDSPEQV